MTENRTDALGSLKSAAGKRTLPRLRFSIRRMMTIIVGLAFLFALLALAERSSRRASLTSGHYGSCASNIHNIVLSILGYHAANGTFPTGTWPNPELEPESRLSWYALILPQIDCQEMYDVLETDQPWNSGQNELFAH